MTLLPKNNGAGAGRDQLALMRTHMANERTLLAYLRTALMLVVTGGTILKFLADIVFYQVVGWIIITSGITVAVLGIKRYRQYQRQFAFDANTAQVDCKVPAGESRSTPPTEL